MTIINQNLSWNPSILNPSSWSASWSSWWLSSDDLDLAVVFAITSVFCMRPKRLKFQNFMSTSNNINLSSNFMLIEIISFLYSTFVILLLFWSIVLPTSLLYSTSSWYVQIKIYLLCVLWKMNVIHFSQFFSQSIFYFLRVRPKWIRLGTTTNLLKKTWATTRFCNNVIDFPPLYAHLKSPRTQFNWFEGSGIRDSMFWIMSILLALQDLTQKYCTSN